VDGEFSIIFTAYNLRRAISIFGVKSLIDRLREACLLFFRNIWAILKRYKAIFSKNSKPIFLKIKKPDARVAA